jgi:hypothetical protein
MEFVNPSGASESEVMALPSPFVPQHRLEADVLALSAPPVMFNTRMCSVWKGKLFLQTKTGELSLGSVQLNTSATALSKIIFGFVLGHSASLCAGSFHRLAHVENSLLTTRLHAAMYSSQNNEVFYKVLRFMTKRQMVRELTLQ